MNKYVVESIQVHPDEWYRAQPSGVHIDGIFDSEDEAKHFVKIHISPNYLLWYREVSGLKFSGPKKHWPKRKT